eukprot:Tbor_TRINITY_DN5529_c1_g2::TRINITY_DN5529_c1_g2_i1::g.12923::m.12923
MIRRVSIGLSDGGNTTALATIHPIASRTPTCVPLGTSILYTINNTSAMMSSIGSDYRAVGSTALGNAYICPIQVTGVLTMSPLQQHNIAQCSVYTSTQKRYLKQARTPFGFYRARYSRMQYPPWRRPYSNGRLSLPISCPHYFFQNNSKTQLAFLPRVNYITGDWNGLFSVDRQQIYTLQHAISGAKCRVRRFPSMFSFENAPSRWLIGKTLATHARPRMTMYDEQMLTKKQRLDYVKAGLLPK